MNTPLNPPDIHAPLGAYHHTMSVPAGSRLVSIAGQVGVGKDGHAPAGAREQAAQAFRNLRACLAAHDMGPEDLIKLTIFLVSPVDIETMRAARTEVLGKGIEPPSTLLIVTALASPNFLIEVEAMAAK